MDGNSSNKRFEGLSLLKHSKTSPPDNPGEAVLETFDNTHPDRGYEIVFDCPEFTSICPVTGQPDFGKITITYVPNAQCVESKSLKLFLFSFRNHGAFHEEVVNLILDRIVAACGPRRAEVLGEFRPRGGIAIKVKASYPDRSDR